MEKLQGKVNVLIRSRQVTLRVHEEAFSLLWHLGKKTEQRGEQHERNPDGGGAQRQLAEGSGHGTGPANRAADRAEQQ